MGKVRIHISRFYAADSPLETEYINNPQDKFPINIEDIETKGVYYIVNGKHRIAKHYLESKTKDSIEIDSDSIHKPFNISLDAPEKFVPLMKLIIDFINNHQKENGRWVRKRKK